MFKSSNSSARVLIILFGLGVFALLQSGRLNESQFWQRGEGFFLDRRYADRLNAPGKGAKPEGSIQLVAVKASTLALDLPAEEIAASPVLQMMHRPWPWNRAVYAAVLEKLFGAGAKVVALDITFAGDNEGDEALARVLEKYRDRVVIASTILGETYLPPAPELLPGGPQGIVGLATLWWDVDGVVRRGRYRVNWDATTSLTHMSAMAVKKFRGAVELPPFSHDNLIDFQGPPGTYEAVPLEDMFVDRLWHAPPLNGGNIFSNKIVIVGSEAEVLHDIHQTPLGQTGTPGPEIQAQMMATLLRNSSIRDLPASSAAWLTFLMVMLAAVVCLITRSAWREALSLAALVLVFYLACRVAFTEHNLAIPMMSPLCGLVLTGAFGVLCQYSLAQHERTRYRNVLDRYVSRNVAEVILKDHRSFDEALVGKKLPVTVMFCDIRGFTYLAASTEPEELVAQLNEYFHEMVGLVQAEGGTLQRFIGDAFLAAWGDTHSEGPKADALRAMRTAMQMREALVRLNSDWAERPDRVRLSIGVGINHAEVIVGSIGHSEKRMEFTVLGDGVNLASRLDSIAKQFQLDIVVSETVEGLTREHFVYRLVDRLAIIGRNEHVNVYTVLAHASKPPEWLEEYHRAVQLYRLGKFPEAAIGFRSVNEILGSPDSLCVMYLQRCLAYVSNPPPADWDGSSQWSKSAE